MRKYTKSGKSLIVWKKIRPTLIDENYVYIIAKLRIPCRAGRVIEAEDKCRAEYAYVVQIYLWSHKFGRMKKLPDSFWGQSIRAYNFIYQKGNKVTPSNGFKRDLSYCAPGIHFFLTRKEAICY